MIAPSKLRKDCPHTDQETCKCSPYGVTREDLDRAVSGLSAVPTYARATSTPVWCQDLVIKPDGERVIMCVMCGERPPRKNGKPGDKPICERCYQKYRSKFP